MFVFFIFPLEITYFLQKQDMWRPFSGAFFCKIYSRK